MLEREVGEEKGEYVSIQVLAQLKQQLILERLKWERKLAFKFGVN